MKILVSGAAGQIGCALVNQAASFGLEVIGLPRRHLDITDPARIERALAQHRPDLLINAAAYTNLDHAEAEVAQATAVNRDGPGNLARAAARAGIPLFHVSSEYVFAGDAGRPYRESDPTLPTSVYGTTRLAGEQAITANLDQHLILRSSWVYGEYGNNFVKTMLAQGCRSEEVSVVSDQIGCPTRSRSIARVLMELAQRYASEGRLAWGVYHYSSRSPCSWYEFAVEIFRQAEGLGLLTRAPRVSPIASASLPRQAPRPGWSVLDCRRIEATFGIVPRTWQDELPHVLRRLQEMPATPQHPAPSRVPFRLYR